MPSKLAPESVAMRTSRARSVGLTVSFMVLHSVAGSHTDLACSAGSEILIAGPVQQGARSSQAGNQRGSEPSIRTETVAAQGQASAVIGNSLPNARQPQVAVACDGRIYVVFGAGSAIYCSASVDKGNTFAAPVKIAEVDQLALGARRGPRIVVTSKAAVVTAIGHKAGMVRSWRSSDGGQTWRGPRQVNDVVASAREGLHAMAASSDGQIYCVWLDLRNGRTEIYGAGSSDHGETWRKNTRVYRSPSGTVCECCHPSVAFDARGRVHVMFRNFVDGYRDMYYVRSTDGGRTFSEGVKLGAGGWLLDACPMDGGALAVTSQGSATTVWRREDRIFRTETPVKEQLVATGTQPWAGGTRQGVYLVWLSRRPGDLWLLRPNELRPDRLAQEASDPVIAAAPDGNGPVVAAWESIDHGSSRIMATVVSQ